MNNKTNQEIRNEIKEIMTVIEKRKGLTSMTLWTKVEALSAILIIRDQKANPIEHDNSGDDYLSVFLRG